MQSDEKLLIFRQGFLAGWRACRRVMQDGASEYEANDALGKVIASTNGMSAEEAHLWVEDAEIEGGRK